MWGVTLTLTLSGGIDLGWKTSAGLATTLTPGATDADYDAAAVPPSLVARGSVAAAIPQPRLMVMPRRKTREQW